MVYDTIIIGGGIIGLSIARALRKRGCSNVLVVEKGSCGMEASWAAGGMLGPQAETDVAGSFFDLCSASRDLYPSLAEELFDETGIDIELDRSGTLYLAFSETDEAKSEERFRWQRAASLAVDRLSADEVRRSEPFISPDVRSALFFPNDWQVENRKLLSALKRYAELNDIEIRENCAVDSLIADDSRVLGVETSRERIFGEHTITATGAWTSYIKIGVAEMPFAVEPIKGQMVVFKTAKRLFDRVIYSHRGYIVPRADGRILAGSTSERSGFDKSTSTIAASNLRTMSNEIAPGTAALPSVDHWCGLRPFVRDGLPVLGQITGIEGLTIATAHYRNGILLAPVTAKIIAGIVLERNPSILAFSPNRLRLRGVVSSK